MIKIILFILILTSVSYFLRLAFQAMIAPLLRKKLQRESQRLEDDLIQQAHMALGGSPANPIEVNSVSVIELRAESTKCILCGGKIQVSEHQVRNIDGELMRVVPTHCLMCGFELELFVRLKTVETPTHEQA